MSTETRKSTPAELRKEVTQRTVGYVTAGFGLVAGLAWNDAIRTTIEVVVPGGQNTIIAKFIYAFVFTIFLVFVTMQLNKFFLRQEK